MRAIRSKSKRVIASVLSLSAWSYSIALAEPGEPSSMAHETVYNVPGTGPITIGDLSVKLFIQSNGSFAKITNQATQKVSWMEVPGFYGAPITIKALTPTTLLILGDRSSSMKGADIVDVAERKVIDSFLLRDYALSPDFQHLALTRAVIPHDEDEAQGSEVAAVYDLQVSPAANRIEHVIGSPDYDVGRRVYPGRATSHAVGAAPLPVEVHSHMTPYEWSQDSQLLAFIDLDRRLSGEAGNQVIEHSDVRLVVARRVAGGWQVTQKLLEACGRFDDRCGSSFTKVSVQGSNIDIDATSGGRHERRVIETDAMSPVPLD